MKPLYLIILLALVVSCNKPKDTRKEAMQSVLNSMRVDSGCKVDASNNTIYFSKGCNITFISNDTTDWLTGGEIKTLDALNKQ